MFKMLTLNTKVKKGESLSWRGGYTIQPLTVCMKVMEKIKYMNMELLPPKSDVVFKAIFGSEECKDVLCAFLSDVLYIEIPDFKAIELVNNELKRVPR